MSTVQLPIGNTLSYADVDGCVEYLENECSPPSLLLKVTV